ncbi:MAG: phosphonate ABC transporter substrate-binding protein [Betaproteobacteria bacterium HGW-Betaproteobacteria-1]|nr:MAG: phosphonate ABC transporter substrate-binding protein [Betaproteobacteria bacterium HGW-Betaproteobacteria-1]
MIRTARAIRATSFWLPLFSAILLVACGRSDDDIYEPTLTTVGSQHVAEYTVGIHPLHNPQRLMEVYGPIVDHMNANIPEAHFKLEASRNYTEFDKKLYAGHFAFAMPNPYQTVLSLKHGYRIFGKMGDDEDFRGIILIRKDSGIREVADLKGKAVSYPGKTALAATFMPQYYLHTHGIDVNRDIENRYVGSQESSIENVLRGHVAAGATWPVPWKTYMREHPELANQLTVKWQTHSLLNNGWVVRQDVSADIADAFSRQLLSLHETAEGRAMLQRLPVSRFEAATGETYLPVRDFLQEFSRTVREIDY